VEEIINFWSELSHFTKVYIAVFAIITVAVLLIIFRKTAFDFLNFILNSFIKIIIASAIIMAVVMLMFTFVNFSNNQVAFTEGSNFVFNEIKRLTDMIADGASSADVSIVKEAISTDIQYMERLGVLYKQSSSNELFTFIYIFLSSILLGVGAYLLSRVESRAEKIKEMHSNLDKNYSDLAKEQNELTKNSEALATKQKKMQSKLTDDYSKLAQKQTEMEDNSEVFLTNQDELRKKYSELLKMYSELKHKSKELF